MNRIIKHRKLHGLKSSHRAFEPLEGAEAGPLSEFLDSIATVGGDWSLYLVGALDKMTREYMREPLDKGWELVGESAFKHRTVVYREPNNEDRAGRKRAEISVKLISHRESWFPGCEDLETAIAAWKALASEWSSTGLPFLSSPAATGKALLWETLPRDVEFPSLDDDLARLIRANSPQHRIEWIMNERAILPGFDLDSMIQYDGRWMYAAMCGLDRLPIGEPKRVGGFVKYQPGIYNVRVRIPKGWNHIGLLPVKSTPAGGAQIWGYPCAPDTAFITWAFEPELTLAIEGVKKLDLPAWEIEEVYDGYAFEKGRPLLGWSNKLIEMRENLQAQEKINASPSCGFAATAIRQILNHTIGAMHKNEYQRETFISDDNYRKWRRENPHLAEGDDVLKVEGGYMVPTFVADNSPLSIFMPHWSSTIYSLARARVAEWALRCDPSTLVKIHGDAIYSTVAQPGLDKLDTQRLGQPRRK